ncbi:PIG-L deacetylase family protein [Salinactinospora qingdaonensis]|uniref:PIG-L deacetylase family protein n=1 Tax=Salinactinospora qingdaonensis TaxID=702744 RepID=UPI0031EEFF13
MAATEVERALVIVAHPDDAEFWAGGTLAGWAETGIAVTICVLTDGEQGGFDSTTPRSQIPRIRRAEQQAAAEVQGIGDVRFLGLTEEDLHPTPRLKRSLVALIRELRPRRILTWSPEWNWQRFRSSHPNHRATGEATLSAIYPDAGNRFAHTDLREQGLEAWNVEEIWLINAPEPNHYVNVTSTFEHKVAAVRAHESQVGNRSDLAAELRARIEPNTAAAGLEPGELAEAFQVVFNR